MLRLTRKQAQAMVLFDRDALIADLSEYLEARHPGPVRALPPGLLNSILNETLKIAFAFQIYDIAHLRFIADLRWTIAPGYFRQPNILALLNHPERDEAARIEDLTAPEMDKAWANARRYRDHREWRLTLEDLEL